MVDARRRLSDLEAALSEHAALRRTQEMEEMDRARQWFLRNRAELMHVLGAAEASTFHTNVPDGWIPASFDPTEREFSVELGRHWHNYVAAATTVVDHMRELFKEQPDDLAADYRRALKQHVAPLSPVVDFVHRSRQVTLHSGVFNAGYSVSFTRDGHSTDVYLSTEILLNRYKSWWTAPARQYILDNAPRIVLNRVVRSYDQPADDLYEWFEDRFYEYHYPTMAAFEQLANEYRQVSEIVNPGGLPLAPRGTSFPPPEAYRRQRQAARDAATRPVPPKARKKIKKGK